MRLITLALATMLAFSSTFAFAHSHHRHHRTHSSGPNGAAGGGTSLSGTGSSQFGGSVPGATRIELR
jgi:hypothetical protein